MSMSAHFLHLQVRAVPPANDDKHIHGASRAEQFNPVGGGRQFGDDIYPYSMEGLSVISVRMLRHKARWIWIISISACTSVINGPACAKSAR